MRLTKVIFFRYEILDLRDEAINWEMEIFLSDNWELKIYCQLANWISGLKLSKLSNVA